MEVRLLILFHGPTGTSIDFLKSILPDHTKSPTPRSASGIRWKLKCLAVSYFHMGKPHTIIGAERFHYRVRDGIGWFPLAIATKQDCQIQRAALHASEYATPQVENRLGVIWSSLTGN